MIGFRGGYRSGILLTLPLLFFSLPGSSVANPADPLEQFFDANGAIMLMIEPESGRIIRANTSAADFYGLSTEELQRMSIQDINMFTPEQVKEERKRAAEEHRNYFIFRHRLADGNVRRVEVFSHPVSFRGQEVLLSIIHDVSNEKLVRQTLDHYSGHLEFMVDERTAQLRRYQWFLIVLVLVQFLIIGGLLHNRSRRKKAEEALVQLNAELETKIASAIQEIREKEGLIHEHIKRRARDDLLIDLAHHWRQPINTAALEVQNIADHVDGIKSPEKVQELIQIVVNELTTLSHTITRLTRFYEHDASHEIGLKEGLEKSLSLAGMTLKSRGVSIQADISDGCTVQASAEEWVDLFSAFFVNARDIKEERDLGQVNIRIEARSTRFHCILIVEDDGGGIEPSLLPDRLFEAYVTTRFKSRDKGLGLYTVRSIVSYRLGGTIEAENTPAGARFTIRIPYE